MKNPAKILLVDDEPGMQRYIRTLLELDNYKVETASTGEEALERLQKGLQPDLVLLDVLMPGIDGLETLEKIRQLQPNTKVVMLSCVSDTRKVVQAIRQGATDYLTKPFQKQELDTVIQQCLDSRRVVVPGEVEEVADDTFFIAASAAMRRIRSQAALVANVDIPVLLLGESGTGKEVLARYIHTHSKRHAGPFVAVNCAAIPEQMLEALLFGYEKGAFTGAQARSVGKFVQANGGTLLLDEVTEMDLSLQAKLLRVLQEREVEPLGASKPLPLDVRVIATSNRDLEQAVREGEFREDLFYRLSVFPLKIPPLRERAGDLPALARRFVEARSARPRPLSAEAVARLAAHGWPGNVRELENVMQRALLLSEGEPQIEAHHLGLEGESLRYAQGATCVLGADLAGELWEEETRRIVAALEMNHGVRTKAAEQLGLKDRTLRYKLQKMRAAGLKVPGDRV
jgi:two-component system response regulator FlrC